MLGAFDRMVSTILWSSAATVGPSFESMSLTPTWITKISKSMSGAFSIFWERVGMC
jgi:hypothetical protein